MIFASFHFRVIKPNKIYRDHRKEKKRNQKIERSVSSPCGGFGHAKHPRMPSYTLLQSFFVTPVPVYILVFILSLTYHILFCRLTKYVRSYGDRNNDLNSVSKCMSSSLGNEANEPVALTFSILLSFRPSRKVQRDSSRILA